MLEFMKNCEALVSFPRLAIDNRKALSCLRMKFSSVGEQRKRERSVRVRSLIRNNGNIQGRTGQKRL